MYIIEFGFCIYLYIDEFCLKYRNCFNCIEYVCIKGDIEKKKWFKDWFRKEIILWVKDKEVVSKNVIGVVVWFEIRELII